MHGVKEKKMARLIRAVDLMKRTDRYAPYISDTVRKELRYVPTVDPVKHGHWELSPFDGNWMCSKCGNKPYHDNMKNMNYCPNCGAKMDEVSK